MRAWKQGRLDNTISPNFNIKNMISTNDFPWKKLLKFVKFQKKSLITKFYNKF